MSSRHSADRVGRDDIGPSESCAIKDTNLAVKPRSMPWRLDEAPGHHHGELMAAAQQGVAQWVGSRTHRRR